MIDIGDWIEMPEFHADGNVIDVQLHTVTVQNFDKTITNIPTKELTTNSFRNWREVSRSGLRRIKRSIYIDVSTIRFLTEPEIRRFSDTDLLAKYMRVKLAEVNPGGPAAGVDSISFEGHRRLTNIGTFRAYVSNYLERLDAIDTENSMFLVRQLQPGQHGLPIEVYCFSTATEWSAYEDVQADLFDHLLAVIGEFGLRVFQDPSVEEKGLTVTIPDMAPTHESDLQAHQ
jgi:miniconductance mechanosensitive channel